MIYDFEVPYIVDTKSLVGVFLNKKYVTQEHVQLLTKVDNDRARFKILVAKLLTTAPIKCSEADLQELSHYLESSSYLVRLGILFLTISMKSSIIITQ